MYKRLHGTEFVIVKQMDEPAYTETDDGTLERVQAKALVSGYGEQLFLSVGPHGEQLHEHLVKNTRKARYYARTGKTAGVSTLIKLFAAHRKPYKPAKRSRHE